MAGPPQPRSAQEQLRRDERAAILRRRRRAGFSNAQARQLPTVGLALSGGGVRSATFALGLVRGLAAQGLLRRMDYLSSVSGGGFTAAMLGRLVCALGIDGAQAQLADGQSKVLDWLRRNGRYLSPAGARDLGTAGVSYLRAFIAIHLETLFALIPLALLVTLPHVMHITASWNDPAHGNDTVRWLDPVAWDSWPSPWLALALTGLVASAPGLLLGYWVAPETRQGPARPVYRGDVMMLLALAAMALLASWFALRGPAPAEAIRQARLVPSLLALALWSAALGHGYAMWRLARSGEGRTLAVARLRSQLTQALRAALGLALVLAGLGLLDRASWWVLQALSAADDPAWLWSGLGLGGAALVVLRAVAPALQQLAMQAKNDSTRALGPLLLDIAGRLATLLLVLAWLVAAQWWLFSQAPTEWARPLPAWMRWLLLLALAALWWGITAGYAQAVNSSSLYSFYMARLVRAYLAVGNARRGLWSTFTPLDTRLHSVTEVADGDDLDLATHRPECAGGPIQLVNTCLNQTRDDASGLFNADRKGTLLTASARALEVGPRAVVRCDGAARAAGESGQGLGTLGHWVAVSGAAAAPGAGSLTSTGWALVMFLLGIRLGHWMPAPLWQPGAMGRFTAWAWRHAPKPLMLWAEASATFHGQARPWWYASDGGHFDNTGVYALIKRECDFILLSDAGTDADFQYEDIENLVRKVRIDLDAEIEFYPRHEAARLFTLAGGGIGVLAPDDLADHAGSRGVLLARIRYRCSDTGVGEREGTLLVVKPRLHAALDLDLLAYARRHVKFPHDPTSDQFFDEAQWESYHRLGEDSGRALYDRWLGQLPGWDRQQLHKLAAPAPLRRGPAPEAAGDEPGWRRGTKAAVIGGSVGLGAVGALLLGLWQAQDQIRRGGEERRQAVQQMLVEVSRELRDLQADTCPRLSVHTVGQVARLRTLQGSPSVTPQDEQTLGLLLGEVAQACQRRAQARTENPDACGSADDAAEQLLCAAATKPTAEADALSYWDPPQRTGGARRSLAEAWALMRGHPSADAATVAVAPKANPAQPPSPPPPAAAQPPAARPPVKGLAPPALPPAATGACQPAPPLACKRITIYTQIYDESARERAERLRAAFKDYGMTPIENVSRSAEARQQRRPVPWQQPTLIAHDAAARACADEMAKALENTACWPREAERPVLITRLPASLKARPATLELWLPTPPQDRAAAR